MQRGDASDRENLGMSIDRELPKRLITVFLIAGCNFGGEYMPPPYQPDPCGTMREYVLFPWAAAGDLGVAVAMFDGSLRVIDVNGTLQSQVQLDPRKVSENGWMLFVGDAVFLVARDDTLPVVVVRNGASTIVTPPLDCWVANAQRDGDGVRVIGNQNGRNGNQACTYRVRPDGTVEDSFFFDGTGFGGVALSGGGYVLAGRPIVRYDSAGHVVWQRDLSDLADVIEAVNGIYALVHEELVERLVWVPLDGSNDVTLTNFVRNPSDSSNSYLQTNAFAAIGDQVMVEIQHKYGYANELVRATPSGVLWSNTLSTLSLGNVTGGAFDGPRLLLNGDALIALDLNGVLSWQRPRADAVAVDDQGQAYVVEAEQIDMCRQHLKVTALDVEGNERWTWRPFAE